MNLQNWSSIYSARATIMPHVLIYMYLSVLNLHAPDSVSLTLLARQQQ